MSKVPTATITTNNSQEDYYYSGVNFRNDKEKLTLMRELGRVYDNVRQLGEDIIGWKRIDNPVYEKSTAKLIMEEKYGAGVRV